MASDYLDLGPTPYEEACEQLGSNYNPTQARRECKSFVNQLKRYHGEPPAGAYYCIASNPHDFGTYLSVRIYYDTDDRAAVTYAFQVEADIPPTWDDIAKQELLEAV